MLQRTEGLRQVYEKTRLTKNCTKGYEKHTTKL